jgi:hypothetical protein
VPITLSGSKQVGFVPLPRVGGALWHAVATIRNLPGRCQTGVSQTRRFEKRGWRRSRRDPPPAAASFKISGGCRLPAPLTPSPKATQRLLILSVDVSRAIRKLRRSDPSFRVADSSKKMRHFVRLGLSVVESVSIIKCAMEGRLYSDGAGGMVVPWLSHSRKSFLSPNGRWFYSIRGP